MQEVTKEIPLRTLPLQELGLNFCSVLQKLERKPHRHSKGLTRVFIHFSAVLLYNLIKTQARITFVVKTINLPKIPLSISPLGFREQLLSPQLKVELQHSTEVDFLGCPVLWGSQELQPGALTCLSSNATSQTPGCPQGHGPGWME